MMKRVAKSLVRRIVFNAPWGLREALFEACVDRIGDVEILGRLLRRIGITELGAHGPLGLIRSSVNDRVVLVNYAKTGKFEEPIANEIVSFFGDGAGTYIDIGANIGLMTIPVARNQSVNCLCFEPDPTNFGFLKANVATNVPESHVELYQAALMDQAGIVMLALADGNLGDHRVTKTSIGGRDTIPVQAFRLDDFIDRVEGPLVVKIDTQGAEPWIVGGGADLLSKASLVVMEFCPYLMRQLGGDIDSVLDLICTFDEVSILPAGATTFPPYISPDDARATLVEKLRTAQATDGDYVDIVARRSSGSRLV